MRLRERVLVSLTLCYLAGLAFAGVYAGYAALSLGLCMAAALFCFAFFSARSRFCRSLLRAGVCLTAAALGLWIGIESAKPAYANVNLQDVSMTMTVRRVIKENSVLCTDVTCGEMRLDDALVYLDPALAPLPGQTLTIAKTDIVTPKADKMPYSFNMQRYAFSQGAHLVVYAAYDDVAVTGCASGLLGWCERSRRAVCAQIDALFGPHADLVKALAVGMRGDLSDQINEAFSKSGITHLLAISGLHMALIAGAFFALLFPLRLGYALRRVLVMLLVGLYGLFVGFPPSVARAVLMLWAFYLSRIFLARYDGMTALACTALFITLLWPAQFWSAGFQLSYAAVAGILLFARPLGHAFGRALGLSDQPAEPQDDQKTAAWRRIGSWAGGMLAEMTAVSVSAQIFVLPLLAWMFGEISCIGVLVNLLAIPLANLLLVGSLIALPLSLLPWPWAAAPVLWVCRICAEGLKATALCMSRLPFAVVEAHVPWGVVCLMYLAALIFSFDRFKPAFRIGMRTTLCVSAIALYLLEPTLSQPKNFTWTVLPVGEGDAMLLQKGRDTILIDSATADQQLYRTLTALGVDVDLLVLTHGHADHAGGLSDLIKYDKVNKVILWADAPVETYDEPIRQALLLAPALGVPVQGVRAGDVIVQGDISLTVLAPDTVSRDENRNSLVLLAQCDGRRILLMGDADASVESSLALPEADAVKVAHHGSKTATSQAFVQAVHPDTAVISVARNHYGHPDMQVLGRLWQVCRRVYITQYDGVVRIEFAPAE